MDLRAFVADLEQRASLICDSAATGASDFGSHCRKPLPKTGKEHRRVSCKDYCEVCADLFDTVLKRRYFVGIQLELEIRRGRFNHIHPDDEHFFY